MEKVLEILKEIDERLANIEADIKLLREETKGVEKNCVKMGKHIDFVQNTYEVVRSPLNFLKKKLEFVMGSSHEGELLAICNNSS
jgi:hypothetical protein